jgi:osmotically-inducible protein OsmY
MKNTILACTILAITMALAGCSESRKTTLGLDVNLYVHPTSADPMDIILQTAITKRLNDSSITRLGLIHVRVEDRTVILTGTAKENVRDEAERIAQQTELTLNGEPIRPKGTITNRIDTK